jgi:hypothetical protein
MAQAHRERHHPSQAETEDIGAIEVEMFEERRYVIGQKVELHRSVDVTGVPVPLQFNADHLMVLGQRRDHGTKGQVEGQQAAMQKDQGPVLAVHLVVEVQAIDRRVVARRRTDCPKCGRGLGHSRSLLCFQAAGFRLAPHSG